MRMKREIAAGALLMGTLAAILFIGRGAEGKARTVYAQFARAAPFDLLRIFSCLIGKNGVS